MRSTLLYTCLALLPLTACSSSDQGTPAGESAETTPAPSTSAPATGEEALAALRAHTEEFMARAEHDAQRVKVRHLLVMFDQAPRSTATRTRDEAEQLAADLYARALAGEDFAALVAQYSDDSPEGIYIMVESGGRPPQVFNRNGMVPAFGDAGWRLQPGELGVVAESPDRSPYGWHLVQRIE